MPIDSSNSTTTPLTSSATYTGSWVDVHGFNSISVLYSADVAGTMYAEFSTDGGVTADRSLQLSSGTDTPTSGLNTLIPVSE
jgi:hypothetical protein